MPFKCIYKYLFCIFVFISTNNICAQDTIKTTGNNYVGIINKTNTVNYYQIFTNGEYKIVPVNEIESVTLVKYLKFHNLVKNKGIDRLSMQTIYYNVISIENDKLKLVIYRLPKYMPDTVEYDNSRIMDNERINIPVIPIVINENVISNGNQNGTNDTNTKNSVSQNKNIINNIYSPFHFYIQASWAIGLRRVDKSEQAVVFEEAERERNIKSINIGMGITHFAKSGVAFQISAEYQRDNAKVDGALDVIAPIGISGGPATSGSQINFLRRAPVGYFNTNITVPIAVKSMSSFYQAKFLIGFHNMDSKYSKTEGNFMAGISFGEYFDVTNFEFLSGAVNPRTGGISTRASITNLHIRYEYLWKYDYKNTIGPFVDIGLGSARIKYYDFKSGNQTRRFNIPTGEIERISTSKFNLGIILRF